MGLKVISDGKSFYRNFETYGILRWFLNLWYLTEVLIDFSRGLKNSGEHVP